MRSSIGAEDRQFLDLLNRLGTPTVQELCEELEITATAVRQRLSRMQAEGLVSRTVLRVGRGRPSHRYAVTESGLRNLGENYRDLALILWKELHRIDDHQVRDAVMNRIKDSLVTRYSRTVVGETMAERVSQLGSSLNDYGFDTEVEMSGDLPILRESNCPYLELAEVDSSICELEQSVFQEVLGTEIRLTQCCLEGHHCCEFQPVEATSV
ncbi:MAG: MarR family transcriptional regulator [Planctomycetota bacterium]|nr:MarR family transcriptional regulator [Planctomycetota bacterium]